jgi:hypothetical protein
MEIWSKQLIEKMKCFREATSEIYPHINFDLAYKKGRNFKS